MNTSSPQKFSGKQEEKKKTSTPTHHNFVSCSLSLFDSFLCADCVVLFSMASSSVFHSFFFSSLFFSLSFFIHSLMLMLSLIEIHFSFVECLRCDGISERITASSGFTLCFVYMCVCLLLFLLRFFCFFFHFCFLPATYLRPVFMKSKVLNVSLNILHVENVFSFLSQNYLSTFDVRVVM